MTNMRLTAPLAPTCMATKGAAKQGTFEIRIDGRGGGMRLDERPREELHLAAVTCQDYRPIALATNACPGCEEDEPEHSGCDSCRYWRDGHCRIYSRH